MDSSSDKMEPADWLEAHGDYLFRFAMKHLHDPAQAEDAIQETLLAALQAADKFSGESSQRTWLTGILKHKIIDIIRKQSREPTYATHETEGNDTGDKLDSLLFNGRGEWLVPQSGWGNPETVLEQDRFWVAFMACLDELPPNLAQIYSLREISGLQTTDLCETLNITSSNCWVSLHRARLALKECLEATWLTDTTGRQV